MSTQPQTPSPSEGPDYATWSTSSLVGRIMDLERQLNAQAEQFRPVPVAADSPHGPQTKSEPNAATTTPMSNIQVGSALPVKTKKKIRDFDPSKYHTRYIALKLSYLGQHYNGFEHANGNITPLPTIEEELWKALRRARLIFPTTPYPADFDFDRNSPRGAQPFELNWDGCQYSKCGRTDRGVSAFGQVISIRVRSARPKRKPKIITEDPPLQAVGADASIIDSTQDKVEVQEVYESEVDDDWDDIRDELPYVQILNNVLPDDIRILAWCPRPPPDFDARFSCRERQYRYFFTQPAFSPIPGELSFSRSAAHYRGIAKKELRDGWLDIDAMREACKYFEGTHDFRNFCRVDTSKQITNFERIIYHASIDLVDPTKNPLGYVGSSDFRPSRGMDDLTAESNINENQPSTPLVYTFTLHGSAFLWHQVRHMVGILFLVGQGVERPSIVQELLDVSKNPCKPRYEMASDAPLVLWDCIFPDLGSDSGKDVLDWVYCGDPRQNIPRSKGDAKFGSSGLVDTLWRTWRGRKIDEILAGALLDLAVGQGSPNFIRNEPPEKVHRSHKIFNGGDDGKLVGIYLPIMQKDKMDTVEVQNARYLASRERKGKEVRVKKSLDIPL
jgi:tRNA pseudouridine38/39 synthase